ncbi:MAG: T9SS type A sorting domain-containing protein [Vicingaceae bacterium]
MRITLLINLLILVAKLSFAQGPYAPPAGQTGSTAIHQDSIVFVTWATQCAVTKGPQDISDNNSPLASVGNSSSAIGKAGDNGIVSLGDGGSAILTFNAPIKNGAGADFAIFENSFSDVFLELAFVEVSSDGINYTRFDAISLTDTSIQTNGFGSTDATDIYNLAGKYRAQYGTPFDLDELDGTPGLNIDSITHIRIIDVVGSIDPQYASYDFQNRAVNDPFPTPFGSSGFDLDAVGIIHSTATSINEKLNNNNLVVFPNPFTNVLTVNLTKNDNYKYSITDYTGSVVKTGRFSEKTQTINLEVIDKGLYFLNITSSSSSVTKRIVKN